MTLTVGENGVEQSRKLVRMRVGDIVVEQDTYPRSLVDWHHVSRLLYHLRAGKQLPPPVVRPDGRLVSGLHRLEAHRKLLGDDGEIEVEVHDFDDRAAFLAGLVEHSHEQLPYSSTDLIRITIIAEHLGISDAQLAEAMEVTTERVQHLRGPKVYRPVEVSGELKVEAARPWMQEWDGLTIRPDQYRAYRAASGRNPYQLAHSLRLLIQADLVPGDARTQSELLALSDDLLMYRQRLESSRAASSGSGGGESEAGDSLARDRLSGAA